MVLYYWPPLLLVTLISVAIGMYQTWNRSNWPDLTNKVCSPAAAAAPPPPPGGGGGAAAACGRAVCS